MSKDRGDAVQRESIEEKKANMKSERKWTICYEADIKRKEEQRQNELKINLTNMSSAHSNALKLCSKVDHFHHHH